MSLRLELLCFYFHVARNRSLTRLIISGDLLYLFLYPLGEAFKRLKMKKAGISPQFINSFYQSWLNRVTTLSRDRSISAMIVGKVVHLCPFLAGAVIYVELRAFKRLYIGKYLSRAVTIDIVIVE